jgi:hypothetical protein
MNGTKRTIDIKYIEDIIELSVFDKYNLNIHIYKSEKAETFDNDSIYPMHSKEELDKELNVIEDGIVEYHLLKMYVEKLKFTGSNISPTMRKIEFNERN